MDRILLMLRVKDYFIQEISDSTFFPGRAAGVYLGKVGESRRIGEIGVLHPEVLEKYEIKLVTPTGFYFHELSAYSITLGIP